MQLRDFVLTFLGLQKTSEPDVKTTVQSIFQNAYEEYSKTRKLPAHHRRAAHYFMTCRTSEQGGHIQACPDGHVQSVWYNSCRHRSCPQCNRIQIDKWLENQKSKLIDTAHHHLIFTIPHQFNELWLMNTSSMTDILFRSVSDTLKTLLSDKKYLGAETGFLLNLHTWGRNLSLHPHIHCLITNGGMDNKQQWQQPVKSCFLPVRVVMQVFRGKFCAAVKEAIHDFKLPENLGQTGLKNLLNQLGRKKWNVHAREKYNHGSGVASYLARYVRGGPLNNNQLQRFGNNIQMRYKSHATKKVECQTFKSESFIRQLLIHIPEKGKRTVRFYGLYTYGKMPALNIARSRHRQKPVKAPEKIDWHTYLERLGHTESAICSECQKQLITTGHFRRGRDPTKKLKSSAITL